MPPPIQVVPEKGTELRCPECGQRTCRLCRDQAHPNKTCAEHRRTAHARRQEDANVVALEAKVMDGTHMLCPGCGVVVTKSLGYDMVRCARAKCGRSFRFLPGSSKARHASLNRARKRRSEASSQ